MISDITGTTSNSFQIGRLDGFKIIFAKSAAQTATLTYVFPLDAGAAGQVLTTDGAGNLSWAAAGGGYGTVLPGGSNLSGTYDGDVLVTGNAVMSSDVEVKGDLFLSNNGNLSYSGGNSFIVHGDVFTQQEFNLENGGGANPTVEIRGNLTTGPTFGVKYRKVAGLPGIQRTFTVLGDIHTDHFYANGVGSNSGNHIYIRGNITCSAVLTVNEIRTYGANNVAGNVTVKGICSSFSILAYGSDNAGGNAYNGGTVVLGAYYAPPTGNIFTYGGTSLSGNGGNGGSVIVFALTNANSINTSGGDGTSSGGEAERVFIYGDAIVSSIKTNGGSTTSNGNGRNGKDIFIEGDLKLIYLGVSSLIELKGGTSVNTLIAANGGNLTVHGDLKGKAEYIDASAGNYTRAFGSAGIGGTIIVYGTTSVELTNIISNGGNGFGGANGGFGGTITLYGHVVANIIQTNAGTGASTGPAGTITIAGGGKIKEINNVDSALSIGNSYIYLGGTCIVETLNYTNRAANQLKAYKDEGCILQLASFTDKNILTAAIPVTITNPNEKLIWFDVINNTWLFGSNTEGASILYEKDFIHTDINSTMSLFTLPLGSRVYSTTIFVTQSFDAANPTAKVGVNSGDDDKYMEVTENGLASVGSYEVRKSVVRTTASEALELALAGGVGGTLGVGCASILYSLPKL